MGKKIIFDLDPAEPLNAAVDIIPIYQPGATGSKTRKITADEIAAINDTAINAAASAAASAASDASDALSASSTAVSDAATAQATADTADSNANTALADAATAQSTANTAVSNAATAQSTANTAVSNAATALGVANAAIPLTQRGANNGVATLDAAGKVPASQLTLVSTSFKGNWNATTNTPALTDGTGTGGDFYFVTNGTSRNLGSGAITWTTGALIIHNGTIWVENEAVDSVVSVNGLQGTVVLTSANVADSSEKRYVTNNFLAAMGGNGGTPSGTNKYATEQGLASAIAAIPLTPGPAGPAGPSSGASLNSVDDYGAVGDGTVRFISAEINPLTGLAYGTGGTANAAASARWDKVRTRWSIDTLTITAVTIGQVYTVTGTGTFGVQSTTANGTHTTTTLLASSIRNSINGNGNGDNHCAVHTANVITIYTRSSNAITISGAGMVLGARSATYGTAIIDTATDTIDWVSIQQALYTAEGGSGYGVLNFGNGKRYHINKGLEFPAKTSRDFKKFTANGNNATLKPSNTARFKMMYRDIPGQFHAINGIQSALPEIEVYDLKFNHTSYTTIDTNPSTQAVGLMLAGYKCHVHNCYFSGGDIGLDYQFSLQGLVNNNTFAYQSLYGLCVRNGQWPHAGLAVSQSNGTIMNDNRFLVTDRNNFIDPGQFAGAYIAGASDCEINNSILEGSVGTGNKAQWGIYFDGLGASVVKDFAVHNVHLEKELAFYAIKIVGNPDQQTQISKIILIATGGFTKMVEHGPGYGGTSRVNIKNFSYAPPAASVFLKSIGSGSAWRIEDVMTAAPLPPVTSTANYDAANDWLNTSRTDIWDLTGGGSRPIASRFYRIPIQP